MIHALSHLPVEKQTELKHITTQLQTCKGVEMVILFGSYARGNWVEHMYSEKGTTYEYKSDYDILVVTTHDDLRNNHKIENKLTQTIAGHVLTRVSLIFHSVKHLNQALTMGNYFFKDIKKEGVVLYDSKIYTLNNPKKLSAKESQQKAQEYFNQWYISASDFLEGYEFYLSKNKFHIAAFQLHQSVERYYTAILLVFTDYRPKQHDLQRLDLRVRNCDQRFNVFPQTTEEDKHLFELLQRAYIDARYKMDEYSISKEELVYLANTVNTLKALTKDICTQKIVEIGELNS